MEYLYVVKNFLISSSSEDDESDEERSDSEEEIIDLFFANKEANKVHNIKNFMNTTVMYSPQEFQQHFRITRTSVEELMQKLQLSYCNYKGRPAVRIEKSLLLTLWTLSNGECFRSIASRFDLRSGLAHTVFIKMCKSICNLIHHYITWPTEAHITNVISDFNEIRGQNGFPNVVGCVDGSHILIPGQKMDNSYYNRKGTHSIVVQGICDSRQKFMDVYCGWPGSTHDNTIWHHSLIYKEIVNNRLRYIPQNCYLLGDSAYKLEAFLMVPFKDTGHLTLKQKNFNKKLSSTRVLIENAFGRLKGLFRRLKYLNIVNLKYAKFVILTSCVLHNIAIDDRTEYIQEDNSDDDDDPLDQSKNFGSSTDAVQFRNRLMEDICTKTI